MSERIRGALSNALYNCMYTLLNFTLCLHTLLMNTTREHGPRLGGV